MALLVDGFATVIGMTGAAPGALTFVEKSVQPPDLDVGGGVDATNMRATRMRTQVPKSLITLGASKLTAYYDPIAYSSILAVMGINQIITIRFPDASTVLFRGWLNKFTPAEHREGEDALADIEFMYSSLTGGVNTEIAPVYNAGPTTVAAVTH